MYKIFSLLVISLFLISNAQSQDTIWWDEMGLGYVYPGLNSNTKLESDSFFHSLDSKDHWIDVEYFGFFEIMDSTNKSAKQLATELAVSLDLTIYQRGGTVPNLDSSYYLVCLGHDHDSSWPVISLVILDYNNKVDYEITIDCYDQNIEKGIEIARSFMLATRKEE